MKAEPDIYRQIVADARASADYLRSIADSFVVLADRLQGVSGGALQCSPHSESSSLRRSLHSPLHRIRASPSARSRAPGHRTQDQLHHHGQLRREHGAVR